jgi:hypothetical protein
VAMESLELSVQILVFVNWVNVGVKSNSVLVIRGQIF